MSQAAISFLRALRPPHPGRASSADWSQLLRFCLVGGAGYLVNLAVFVLAIASGVHYLVAATFAFAVAVSCNFAMNRSWTFRVRSARVLKAGPRYLVANLVGLAVNLSVLDLLVLSGTDRFGAQVVAVIAAMPVNFLICRRWSFGEATVTATDQVPR